MIYFVVVYVTVVVEAGVAIYACHRAPYGPQSCTWGRLWRELCRREAPALPVARIHAQAHQGDGDAALVQSGDR